jgi:hypothetical protein
MPAIAVTLAVVGSSVVALMVIRAIATAICHQVTIHRHNIFVNGKVVTTYDKTLINNAKAVDQAAYMHTDALIMLCLGSCSCPV